MNICGGYEYLVFHYLSVNEYLIKISSANFHGIVGKILYACMSKNFSGEEFQVFIRFSYGSRIPVPFSPPPPPPKTRRPHLSRDKPQGNTCRAEEKATV